MTKQQCPLCAAVSRGELDAVQNLLDTGFPVDCVHQYSNALITAAWLGNTSMTRLLLERGASLYVHNDEGGPPLKVAGYDSHIDTMRLLLDWGADVNERSGYQNQTALYDAAFEGCLEVVRLLLERGADVNIKDNEGYTVLQFLRYSSSPNKWAVCDLLKQAGAKE